MVVRERRIWRLRDLVRVEDAAGRGRMVAGDRRCWYFGHRDRPRDFGSVPPEAEGLLLDPREEWTSWLSGAPELVVGSLRPVEHDGRPAWRFTAPEVKGGRPTVTVDAELGLVLRFAREDVGHAETWSDLELLPSLDPAFFVPTVQDLAWWPDPDAPFEEHTLADRAASLEGHLHILDGIVRGLADPHALLDVVLAAADRDAAVEALQDSSTSTRRRPTRCWTLSCAGWRRGSGRASSPTATRWPPSWPS